MTEDFEHATQMEAVGEATAQHSFAVGILKGNALTPKKEIVIPPYSVETLVENHVPVRTERGMGKGADFIDLDYADAGALIEDDARYVFQKSDILVSLSPLTTEELSQLKESQILITPIPLSIWPSSTKKISPPSRYDWCITWKMGNYCKISSMWRAVPMPPATH